MTIVGYTFDADVHCPTCTAKAVAAGELVSSSPPRFRDAVDEHGLPLDLEDHEGNTVGPIFSTDEPGDSGPPVCGDCFAPLDEPLSLLCEEAA